MLARGGGGWFAFRGFFLMGDVDLDLVVLFLLGLGC